MADDSIFNQEVKEDSDDAQFEDKIVQHLTGDVESIAIPNSQNQKRDIVYSSLESNRCNNNTIEEEWSSDTCLLSPLSTPSSSIDVPMVSTSGYYPVTMPKYEGGMIIYYR